MKNNSKTVEIKYSTKERKEDLKQKGINFVINRKCKYSNFPIPYTVNVTSLTYSWGFKII